MAESILDSVKQALGVPVAQEAFDSELVMHINSVLADLTQIGVGPAAGFLVMNNADTWDEFIADDFRYNSVKSYTFLRVKTLFDPPPTSFVLDAMKEQIREFEWRLNAAREETNWVDPNPVV